MTDNKTIGEIVDDFAIQLVNELDLPFQSDSKKYRKMVNMLNRFYTLVGEREKNHLRVFIEENHLYQERG